MTKTTTTNQDADNAFFLDRELVAAQAGAFATMTSPLAAELLIPAYRLDPAGATSHEYYMSDTAGIAELISGSDNTFPIVNATRSAKRVNYISSGASTWITYEQMRADEMALLNLAQEQVTAVMMRIRQIQNHTAFYGQPESGVYGWFNTPDIATAPATNGDWLNPLTTSDQILDDMNAVIDGRQIATDGAVTVDTLVMPIAQYAHISSVPRSTGSDTTILQYFQRNRPNVTVVAANELVGAFTGGADGMIAYQKNPTWFKQLISIDAEARPTVVSVDGYRTPFETRLGGVVLVYPESQQFSYGI